VLAALRPGVRPAAMDQALLTAMGQKPAEHLGAGCGIMTEIGGLIVPRGLPARGRFKTAGQVPCHSESFIDWLVFILILLICGLLAVVAGRLDHGAIVVEPAADDRWQAVWLLKRLSPRRLSLAFAAGRLFRVRDAQTA